MSDRISSNPEILSGAPCITGTRIPVYIILDQLASGAEMEQVLRDFPRVSTEDVRACLAHAARLLDGDEDDLEAGGAEPVRSWEITSDRLSSDPGICGGGVCIKGTRIPVYVVLGYLSAGESVETILENFPWIGSEDVRACLSFAADICDQRIHAA